MKTKSRGTKRLWTTEMEHRDRVTMTGRPEGYPSLSMRIFCRHLIRGRVIIHEGHHAWKVEKEPSALEVDAKDSKLNYCRWSKGCVP